MNNNNIATLRTLGAAAWGTGVGLLLSGTTSLDTNAVVFITSAAVLVISRVGTELQQTNNKWLKLVGDILLFVDKSPLYVPNDPPGD